MMKHILFIAPHSFPIKSSESICNSKVAYALAEAGYKVDVFSCIDSHTYPTNSEIDDFLSSSPNIDITYVDSKHIISKRLPFWRFVYNVFYNLFFLLKTGYYYWQIWKTFDIADAVNKKIKEYGKMPYDVIITRGFLTEYVGIYMVKKYGIKWIANWNDPYPDPKFPEPYGRGADTKLPYFQNRIFEDIQDYIS